MKNTIVYIDGYNFFYSIKNHWLENKADNDICLAWCDFARLVVEQIFADRKGYRLAKIRYFTAKVPSNPKYSREKEAQKVWLEALSAVPNLEIHYGFFTQKTKYPKERQEKQTDVNIAVEMITDSFEADCTHAILITNDADLQPAAEKIIKKMSFEIWVPPFVDKNAAWRSFCKKHKLPYHQLSRDMLFASRLPEQVSTSDGSVECPKYWRRKCLP